MIASDAEILNDNARIWIYQADRVLNDQEIDCISKKLEKWQQEWNTHGKPLNLIAELRVGDAIVVEVPEGWYTYRFRTLEYVEPSGVGVLEPVPQADGVAASDSIITLTSCNPAFSTAERIIAYGAFESWTPRASGPPTSITEPLED